LKSWDLKEFKVEPLDGRSRFHDFNLPIILMHAISDLGFQYCSPIQARTLPYTLRGHDIVGKRKLVLENCSFLTTIITELLIISRG